MSNDYQNFETEDFLLDDLFIEWLLNPNKNNFQDWNDELSNLVMEYPSRENEIKMAVSIFNSCRNLSSENQNEDLDIIWNRIRLTTIVNSNKTFFKKHWVIYTISKMEHINK